MYFNGVKKVFYEKHTSINCINKSIKWYLNLGKRKIRFNNEKIRIERQNIIARA